MPSAIDQAGPARLRLIGPFRLTAPDGSAVAISSRRARGLLAHLHLESDHRASRERLCGLLWSDRGEAQARASLRQCVFELRDGLTAAGIEGLDIGRETIGLRPAGFTSDASEIEQALAGGEPERLAERLAQAGPEPLLSDLEIPGLFDEWLEQARARFDQDLSAGVRGRLERLEAGAGWPQVRMIAEAFLRRDPLDEAVVAAAIRADAATGNSAAAHRRFQVLQAALAKEFGVAPGPAAREALASLAAAPASAADAAPADAAAPSAPARAPPAMTTLQPPLVIVAQFGAAEAEDGAARLAATLRDEVVSGLYRFRDLRVIPDPRPPDLVGADITPGAGAAYILSASLAAGRSGERLIAHLLRVADRQVVWSDRIEAPGHDLVETIDRIIAKVVGAILPMIDADLVRNASHLPREDVYRRYVVARDAALRARTHPQARAAAQELESLIAAHPDFALPYLPLATLYQTDFRMTRAKSCDEALRERALELANTALTLDRGHVHAYTVAGFCHLRRRQWGPARSYLEQAFALNPFHPRRVMEVAWGLMYLGDLERCGSLLDRYLLLIPQPTDDIFMDKGLLAFVHGDHRLAATYFDLIADPDVWCLLYAAINATAQAERADGEASEGADARRAAARRAIEAIWPEPAPTTQAMVDWISSHHPFAVAEVEKRFLGTAYRALDLAGAA